MPPLPVVSGEECIKGLERLGIRAVRTRGDHVQVRAPNGMGTTVPCTTNWTGLLRRGILGRLGISVEEFVHALRR